MGETDGKRLSTKFAPKKMNDETAANLGDNFNSLISFCFAAVAPTVEIERRKVSDSHPLANCMKVCRLNPVRSLA